MLQALATQAAASAQRNNSLFFPLRFVTNTCTAFCQLPKEGRQRRYFMPVNPSMAR